MACMVKVSAIRKRLNRDRRREKTWRAVAALYAVNVRYVYELAVKGIEPSNQEIRYRLGLEQRPLPEWVKAAARFLREKERLHV